MCLGGGVLTENSCKSEVERATWGTFFIHKGKAIRIKESRRERLTHSPPLTNEEDGLRFPDSGFTFHHIVLYKLEELPRQTK